MNLIYWLLCLLIGLIPAVLLYRSDRRKNIPVKWLPALLRFLTCFFTAALLLAPAFPTTHTEEEKPLLLWLQDNSSSMRAALGKDSVAYREKMQRLEAGWRKDYTVVRFAFGADLSRDSQLHYDQRSTNIARALQAAAEQYQDQNIGAIIIASDGIYNEGLDPLYAPASAPVPIYTIGLGDSTQPRDISIGRVYANKTVALNSKFEIMVDLRADKLNGGNTTLSVLHNGSTIGQQPVKIDKDRYTASFHFEAEAKEKGFQRYSIAIPVQEGEQNTLNNRMDFFVEVIDDETKVLLLAAAPHPDIAAIKEALESVPQYKVDVRFGSDVPPVTPYHLIIAHQVPSSAGVQLQAAGKPVWYILGRQSNLNVLSQQQDLVKIAGGGNPNDVLPNINTAFSYFTLPVSIKEVMGKMPPLQAPYGNYSVAPDAQVLMRQQIGNISTNYPLWVFRNSGTPQAMLCGEGLWRWRLYEYKNSGKHEVVDELIRQTVSLLSVKKDNRPFRLFMDKYVLSDNEPVNLYAELRNDNGELVNGPAVKLSLTDSAGKALAYEMEKNGNSYRLNVGLLAPGSYHFKGTVSNNGKSAVSEGSFLVESVPLERLRTNADFDLLGRMAAQTGGGFFTYRSMDALADSLRNNSQVKPLIHTDKTYTALIDLRWFFGIILLTAIAEWLLRKYWNA
ncbi:vWA domain-containing protein [Taibaiella koreensis]|uniref:vWA domain-containing protein n=1 Tax=Taibaiella koreensis TaxID=1268548 RepID=UPI0013C336CA|nr:vWA domain-containing protein [Taibaiella koreensis]